MKLKTAVVVTVLAAGLVITLFLLQRANETVRQSQLKVADLEKQLAQFRMRHPGLDLLAEEPLPNERLAELMLLRRENSRLKKEKDALAPPKIAKQDQGKSAEKTSARTPSQWAVGQFLPRDQWTDAGLGIPEATVQTMFWAMASGNGRRYLDALLKPEGEPSPSDEELQRVMASVTRSFESAQGITLDARESTSDDEVTLHVTVKKAGAETPEEATTAPELFTLQRKGNEWKIVPGTPELIAAPATEPVLPDPVETDE